MTSRVMKVAYGAKPYVLRAAPGRYNYYGAPAKLTSSVSGGAIFDYYIGPSGSSGNAGTVGSPWDIAAISNSTKQALYAGKRVGLLPGTYDVSALMNPTFHTPVLNINGGPNSSTKTYIGSSDSGGHYSPRTATIDAKGASGFYGGGNSNLSAIMGQGHETNLGSNWGNWTIDGIVFTGFSLWAVHFGNYDGTGGQLPNATVQFCEFTGGSAQNSTVASGVNLAPWVNYTASNGLFTQNYVHDNFGWTDNQHWSGAYIWGLGAVGQTGLTVTYNTFVNTGNIHSKEAIQYNATVAYNYVDMTNKTPSGGPSQNASAIYGFNADTAGVGTGTVIHHNILVAPFTYIGLTTDTGQAGWKTPCTVYNNTCVASGNQSSGNVGSYGWEMSSGLAPFTFYNNLMYDNGFSPASNYGYMLYNTDGFALCNYNCYGGNAGSFFMTVPPGSTSTTGFTARTFSGWQTATGADANSINTAATFTNAGTFANQYTVTTGAAFNAGKVGGTSGGATCNIGAWDGTGRPGASWVT